MAKAKVQAIKFDSIDKSRIVGKKGHTRTGACTCRRNQKCYHGSNNPRKQR
jgi:hypothetical protein